MQLHGQESEAFADAGYVGVEKRDEVIQVQQAGDINADVKWDVAMGRAKLKGMAEGALYELTQVLERVRAQIGARAEQPFRVVKNLFKHRKTRYKGLAKNGAQMFSLFGLANLVIAKKLLLALQAQGAT